MSLLYDALVLLGFLSLWPKFLWQKWRSGKEFPSLRDRLGIDVPDSGGRQTFWIHAVSVGEAKAASPLVRSLRALFPDAFLLVTTSSATGRKEAMRSIPEANAHRFLPLDMQIVIRRWTKQLKPSCLLFVEGDFWYRLASNVKRGGGKVALVSGKISHRSASRFAFFSRLSKKLFANFDLLLVQSELYRNRFDSFAPGSLIAGNLKLDSAPNKVDRLAVANRWGEGPWITVSCTHDPEEEQILSQLAPLLGKLRIFLAPRHPERSQSIANLLLSKTIPFTMIDRPNPSASVVLVDQMGRLADCYAVSLGAIVGGSFTSKVGGHNVLEPCQYGCPSFFGPHMHTQQEFSSLVLSNQAGAQIHLSEVASLAAQLMNPEIQQRYALSAKTLAQSLGGALEKTMNALVKSQVIPSI